MIPFSLPPMTGPCPHCQAEITSPPPPAPAAPTPPRVAPPAPESTPEPPPQVIAEPVAVPAASPVAAPAPNPVAEPVVKPIAEPVAKPAAKPVAEAIPKPIAEPVTIPQDEEKAEDPPTQPVDKAAKEKTKSSGLVPVLIVVLLLLAAGGGAAYYFLLKPKDPIVNSQVAGGSPKSPRNTDADYIRSGWQADAFRTLTAFLEATSVEDKLPHIRDAAALRPNMELFYADPAINDQAPPPAKSFSVNELTEEIRSRGIFLLSYDQPPEGAAEPVRIRAFFKRTKQGLKLDWEVFAQTKYRRFRSFTGSPVIGARETFRVLIAEDAPQKGAEEPNSRTYLMKDPAYQNDTASVKVEAASSNGKELSVINWRGPKPGEPITRTATVELVWTGTPDKPVLTMKRLVSWEFLGLGGTEIPATAP